MSLIVLRKTPVHPLGSTTIQSTQTCQLFASVWLLLMCLHHAVSRWFPPHTKNIFPQRCARSGSSFSLTSNSAEASCQKGLHEAIMAEETWTSTGMSLKTETYITQSPSRYPITNSHSKHCTSTSLIGRTRGRACKWHKRIEKWDLIVGLIRRRWITLFESSFCDLRSSSSHTTGSVLATATTLSWPIDNTFPCIWPCKLALSTWAAPTLTAGAAIMISSTDWCCSSATSKDWEP